MTFDDETTAALRRDLQAAQVGFDAAGAEDMIRVATQADPLGEKRVYAAPLAAAAAVVVIGGGVATFAATRGGGTPTGGGVPNVPAFCATTSAAPSEPPSASAPASEVPPVYTTPAGLPPTTLYPTPVTSTASDLPLRLPTSTPAEPSTSAAIPIGTPVSIPATGTVTLTLPPVSTTADDPCASSAAPSASDLPTPVPTTPCESGTLDPGFCGRTGSALPVPSSTAATPPSVTIVVTARADAGATGKTNVPLAAGQEFVVTELRIRNAGDSGTIHILEGSTDVLHNALSGISDLNFTLDPGRQFPVSTDKPMTVAVECTNASGACTPTVEVTGHYDEPSSPTPSMTPSTHS